MEGRFGKLAKLEILLVYLFPLIVCVEFRGNGKLVHVNWAFFLAISLVRSLRSFAQRHASKRGKKVSLVLYPGNESALRSAQYIISSRLYPWPPFLSFSLCACMVRSRGEGEGRGKDGSERLGGEKGGGGGGRRRIKTEAEGITTLPCFPSRFVR